MKNNPTKIINCQRITNNNKFYKQRWQKTDKAGEEYVEMAPYDHPSQGMTFESSDESQKHPHSNFVLCHQKVLIQTSSSVTRKFSFKLSVLGQRSPVRPELFLDAVKVQPHIWAI